MITLHEDKVYEMRIEIERIRKGIQNLLNFDSAKSPRAMATDLLASVDFLTGSLDNAKTKDDHVEVGSNYELSQQVINNTSGMSEAGLSARISVLLIKTLEDTLGRHPNIRKDIEAFHHKFNQRYEGKSRLLPDDLLEFRIKFIKEEFEEYLTAVKSKSPEGQVDALIDMTYVIAGTLYLMGVDFNEAWNEVQRSNMTKTPVPLGKGKMGFTVSKGQGFVPANFKKFFHE